MPLFDSSCIKFARRLVSASALLFIDEAIHIRLGIIIVGRDARFTIKITKRTNQAASKHCGKSINFSYFIILITKQNSSHKKRSAGSQANRNKYKGLVLIRRNRAKNRKKWANKEKEKGPESFCDISRIQAMLHFPPQPPRRGKLSITPQSAPPSVFLRKFESLPN